MLDMHFYSIYIYRKSPWTESVTQQTWQYPKLKMPQHWKNKKSNHRKAKKKSCCSSFCLTKRYGKIFAKIFYKDSNNVSNSCLMYKNTKSQHLTVKMHSFSDTQKNGLNKSDIKDTEGWTNYLKKKKSFTWVRFAKWLVTTGSDQRHSSGCLNPSHIQIILGTVVAHSSFKCKPTALLDCR